MEGPHPEQVGLAVAASEPRLQIGRELRDQLVAVRGTGSAVLLLLDDATSNDRVGMLRRLSTEPPSASYFTRVSTLDTMPRFPNWVARELLLRR